MKKQSGFVPILILIFLLAIVGAGYFAYKNGNLNFSKNSLVSSGPSTMATPGSTENWKIYIDQKDNFSFKYPQTFNQSELTISKSGFIDLFAGLDSGLIEIFSEKSTRQVAEWWKSKSQNSAKANLAKYKDSIFAGQKSVEVTFEKGYEFSGEKVVFFTLNGSNYYISAFHSNVSCADMKKCWETDLENQILSTFRFTK